MLSVAQISFFSDPLARAPDELLRAWPTVVDVADAAAHAGVRVSVVQASSHRAHFEREGVDYHFLPFGIDTPAGSEALHGLIRSLKPDLLHVQGLGFPRDVLALATAAPGTSIVLQDHADRPPRRPWRWPLWRRGMAAAKGVMFCAHEQARPFRLAGVLGARTKVYEVPESTCRFTPMDRDEARRATRIDGDPCLLWVGHLNPNKDPLTVLDGLALAARQLPGLQLWCCYGQAPLLEEVRARVDGDPLLAGRVHLLGAVPHAEVEQLMGAADFLVGGSHREGSGYAVIEALACGLPPLVTDIASFRALTAGGAVGRLWPRGDARALCQALLQLLAQPQAALHAAARRQFEVALSPAALGGKLRATYSDLLGR